MSLPKWFIPVAVRALLWNLIGCAAYLADVTITLGGCAPPPRAHRADAPPAREAAREEGPDLADADADGVRDAREVRLGTDPREPDSDGDGVRDGDDLAPGVPTPQASFATTDVLASEPGAVLPDPEFDAATGQFVWQTFTGSALWVGRVDAQTGALVPRDGRGTKVDEGLGGVGVGANGPEWVTTPQGPVITYIKPARGDYEVWAARKVDGHWQAAALAGGPPGVRPYGQHVAGASVGRVIYRTRAGDGWDNVWREVGGAHEAHVLPREAGVHNTRWALDDEHVLLGSAPPDYAVVRYDIRDGRRATLTADGGVHHDPYQTTAPEWGGERVIVSLRGPAVNDYPELVVYREVRGAWAPVKVIRPPAAYPQIISPELFAWKGKTYVSFVATEWVDGPMNGVSQVWIAAIDPADDLLRRVSDDAVGVRFDPEPYVGGARPWLFYTGTADSRRETHRCELGL